MRRGYIFKRRGFWVLRYREWQIVEGKRQNVQRAVKLASTDDYPTKRSVELLADKIL